MKKMMKKETPEREINIFEEKNKIKKPEEKLVEIKPREKIKRGTITW